MILYFIPFIFLYLLSEGEKFNLFAKVLNNRYFYYLLSVFFIIFIGLRSEIGCDWDAYITLYTKYSSQDFGEILTTNLSSIFKLDEFGSILITKLSNNIYIFNFIYSILFVIPLFYFCSALERKYFALLISYPYYMIVVGMGPIRQAACISFLMFSMILIIRKRYYSHYLLSLISFSIHQSSIILNGLILIPNLGNIKKLIKKIISNNYSILIVILILIIIGFSFPSIIYSTFYYFKFYGEKIPKAKGAIFLWLMNFIPSIIFIINSNKFNFEYSLKKILFSFSIFGFLLLPLIFFNTVIAYRLSLYLFPATILISSAIPDLELFQIKKSYYINFIYALSFLSLIIWLNFAFHSSCWVPYKNILLDEWKFILGF